MKTPSYGFGQKLPRFMRSIVRQSAYKHDRLLIHSLAAFNFRPPLTLEFPGERLARTTSFSQ